MQPWISTLPSNYKKAFNDQGEIYFVHELCSILGEVNIGKYTYIHGNTRITSESFMVIGKFCSIASGVRIQGGGEHDYTRVSTYPFKTILGLNSNYEEVSGGSISIGNDVWIGEGARILSGSVICDGVVVGAGSVVKGKLLPYGIYVGNPAKLIKKRFPDNIIEFLIDLKWWNWGEDKIFNNSDFFSLCLSEASEDDIKNIIN